MKIEWKQCWRVGISIFILFLCINYWGNIAGFISVMFSALSPLIVGFVIAYLLNILMCFYERHYFSKYSEKKVVSKTKRPVCMILAMLTMVGVIVWLICMIIPELVSCFKMLLDQIPGIVQELSQNEIFKKIVPKDMLAELNNLDWQSYGEKVLGFLTSGISGAVNTVAEVAYSVFSVIVTAVVGFIFSIYFLMGKEILNGQLKRFMNVYLKESWHHKLMHYVYVLDECFRQYIVGKCIDAVILGVMCALGMAVFRFPYAVMIGALVGFTALIPVAGAYIGAGVGAVMILTISPIKALLFIVFIIVLQQIEGNLIYPKVMSSSIGLPGVWVLASITVGGSLSGIVGMLIGVPIAAAVYQIVREDVIRRENRKEVENIAPKEENVLEEHSKDA